MLITYKILMKQLETQDEKCKASRRHKLKKAKSKEKVLTLIHLKLGMSYTEAQVRKAGSALTQRNKLILPFL